MNIYYQTKTCGKCKTKKPISEFSKRKACADGLHNQCKLCDKAVYEKNKNTRANQQKSWNQSNKEKIAIYNKVWAGKNKEKIAAKSANRRAQKLKSTPAWSNNEFDKFVMSEIYALCALRTKLTGVQHHVDHIVPQQSDIVCCLHCIVNLRIIPASENCSKGNHYWPDMP
jgi:hypothetical protein